MDVFEQNKIYISYLFNRALNALSNLNEVLDESRERDQRCGDGYRVHFSNATVAAVNEAGWW